MIDDVNALDLRVSIISLYCCVQFLKRRSL